MAGFSLIRPKEKSEGDKNIVGTSEPDKKEEKITHDNEDKNSQPTSNIEPTDESTEEKEPTPKMEKKQEEPELNMPATEIEKSTIDEMKIIRNRPKEKICCENCQKNFATPLFMYDYSEGKRNLVGCCPYCSQIIGKPPKKLKEMENGGATEIEKLTRLQEKAKKRETMIFQINSAELDELIKNTAYVR